MALDSWMYGDPERVAIRRQEDILRKIKACAGCIHHQWIDYEGERLNRCDIKRFGFGQPNCKQYTTKKGKP